MAVKMMIQFNGRQLTLPINPENITISRTAENEDKDIIGLGHITTKGEPSLASITIESFFPAPNSYFYTGVKPSQCTNFIYEIWNTENINNNVAKLVTTGLPINLNMYFVIESFDYEHRAGEEEDIYYTLEIKKYVPYGAKTVNANLSGLAAARASSTSQQQETQSQNQPQNTQKSYTVVKGDCLWNITKKYTGNGSRWHELYDLNKSVVGSNPNLIYPRTSFNFTNRMVMK